MSRHVLDASAVIAYLDREPGHEQVVDLLEKAGDGRAVLFMTAVNWGEVLYAVQNARGLEKRDEVELTLASHPIAIVEVGQELAKRAARLKAEKKLPYLDCFVVALAEDRRATLVTCDKDFQRVDKNVKIFWLGKGVS
jgi:predicted nucleic acid-binding protein